MDNINAPFGHIALNYKTPMSNDFSGLSHKFGLEIRKNFQAEPLAKPENSIKFPFAKFRKNTSKEFRNSELKKKEFSDVYQQYADAIYRHCYFRVYNKDLAEDLTQETFIKTWKYMVEGKEIKNVKAFLYKVAVNLIIDHSRKKTTVVLDDMKEKEVSLRLHSIESSMIDSFEIKEIIKILDDLEEKYRQVIVMRYISQLSPPEIADILGISTNAVSVKINYAMKKLRLIIASKHKMAIER